ncbi:hypothetical protein KFU94_24280 [Chloroflexi bacterium TSY]|nr:hypothetical protein [Chloroflexi bacterium TSY]
MLTTKLHRPPVRPQLVARPHLIERLHEGLYRKLILLSAPAGFGKTTLISDWLRQVPLPVAWLSLDEGDNDPTRFLTYFVSALAQIDLYLGQSAQELIRGGRLPSIQSWIAILISELTLTESVIVLDDYHLINADSIHEALDILLEHLPQQMHLVISTREDPPFPLARLRARGHMLEIRAVDLRFKSEETLRFLNQTMHLNLTAQQITALEKRTEGWIAGLQLAALSMQNMADKDSFIKAYAGDDKYIVDYLTSEVIARQTPQIQAFLLRTSILDRFTASLCASIMGQVDVQEALTAIEQANLFLIPLDNRRE